VGPGERLRLTVMVLALLPISPWVAAHPGTAVQSLPSLQPTDRTPLHPLQPIRYRFQCDHNRCLDPATGDYTSSSCTFRGCHPSSGVVGNIYGRTIAPGRSYRENGRGYGGYYERPRRHRLPPAAWECNRNRCLDPRTGAYTASSCDRNGCRPSGGIVGYIR